MEMRARAQLLALGVVRRHVGAGVALGLGAAAPRAIVVGNDIGGVVDGAVAAAGEGVGHEAGVADIAVAGDAASAEVATRVAVARALPAVVAAVVGRVVVGVVLVGIDLCAARARPVVRVVRVVVGELGGAVVARKVAVGKRPAVASSSSSDCRLVECRPIPLPNSHLVAPPPNIRKTSLSRARAGTHAHPDPGPGTGATEAHAPVTAARHGLGAATHPDVVHVGGVEPVRRVDGVIAEHAAASRHEVVAGAVGA